MWWILALAVFVSADEHAAAGHNATNATKSRPAGWGNERFHVHLKGCRTSQGVLDPAFNSLYAGPYNLEIDERVTVLIIHPILDLRKYQPRFTPKITLDDKVVEYVPINAIDAVVNFTGRLKGYDKTLELTVSDPEAGYLVGNSMTYYFRVKKNANPAVTSLKWLKLYDVANKELKPMTTHHANKYTFVVPEGDMDLALQFKCQDDSTEARVNGHYFDTGYPYTISMKQCDATLLVACAYSDDEFTPSGEVTRTYMVEIKRNEHLAGTVVTLHTTPDNGHCKRNGKRSWSCVAKTEDFALIASWNKSDATMTIFNDKGIPTRMMDNIPTIVSMESGTRIYRMVLAAGDHNRTFDISITESMGSNVLVLADVPVLLNLWWGQGTCEKTDKGFSCVAKQEAINVVVHFAHSDKIHAQLRSKDDKISQVIQMGLPGGIITIQPDGVQHLVLKMWTDKEHVAYPIVIKPEVRKHHHHKANSGPQTVAEEAQANADAKKKKEKKEKEKKKKVKTMKILDFLANPRLYLT